MNGIRPSSSRRTSLQKTAPPPESPVSASASSSPLSTEGLPTGWVKQFDPVSKRNFYVDTAVPRSTWSHPYQDEQYLRERGRRDSANIRRHSSASQGIPSPVIVGAPHHKQQCGNGEPARKKARTASPKRASCSARDDITRELELLLRRDFSFPGKYCHAATTVSAANPGLNVKGIGIIGLPLSERDARLIQSLITATTHVESPVGNVWELEAPTIECSNPAWARYLDDIVLKDIWQKLAPHCNRPRLELKSLLLWEETSDILEYDCTEIPGKGTDKFGTIHVILPSFYTGGHVQLTFAGSSEHYDLSATSAFSTSLVSWYHGMDCIIKPVESGRRLALSYYILAGQGGVHPSLPPMTEKLFDLRRFMRQWSDIQEYEPDVAPSIIAYPLQYEYRDGDLRADVLKLEDRHKVIHLKGVCDELGFQFGLATLDDHLIGTADETSRRDGQGRPQMLRVNSRRLTIKEVFDFEGIPMAGLSKLELDESDLVHTANEQSDSAPDLVVYEAKNPHVIEFHHSRTVVVLFEKRHTVEAHLHTKRTFYALEKLHDVDRHRSSSVDRKIVTYVLASLYQQRPYNFDAQNTLADIALGWNDSKLWNETARSSTSHGSLSSTLQALQWVTAWKQFSFAGVRESIEYCCEKKGVRKCLDFFFETDPEVFASLDGSNRDVVVRWSNEQLQKALSGMDQLEREDAPLFISLIHKRGLQYFYHVISRLLSRVPKSYDFWTEFLKCLYPIKPESVTSDTDAKLFESIADEALNTIIDDLASVVRSADVPSRNRRLIDVIDLCLSIGRLDMCRRALFTTVPRDQGPDWVPDVLSQLYIPALRDTLHAHHFDVQQKPFNDFFRAVIGCYLRHVLGEYAGGRLRRICHPCATCSALDDFLVSPQLQQAHFVGAKTHTSHLETHLAAAGDIVSYYCITDAAVMGGHVCIVNKHDAKEDPQWRARRKRAADFIAQIGPEQVIEKIMGRRYSEVQLALEGKALFVNMEEGSPRAANRSSSHHGLAIHHVLHGKWVATTLAD